MRLKTPRTNRLPRDASAGTEAPGDQASARKLFVGVHHSVAGYAELTRQSTGGGQAAAGRQFSAADSVGYRITDLAVEAHRAVERDIEDAAQSGTFSPA